MKTKQEIIEQLELLKEYLEEDGGMGVGYTQEAIDYISSQFEPLVSPMLADNGKIFLRLLIRDKKEEYGDELKTDIDLIRAVKQESIVKMDLLLEKLQ